MDNKELRIEIPKGFEIGEFDIKTGTVKFKAVKKDIFERIQYFDDACREVGTTEKDFEKKYKEVLDEQGYATEQAKVIAKALNENWTSNWDNSNEYKYFIYYDMRGKGSFDHYYYWRSLSSIPARLCFKSSELATHAATKFPEIYRTYFKG